MHHRMWVPRRGANTVTVAVAVSKPARSSCKDVEEASQPTVPAHRLLADPGSLPRSHQLQAHKQNESYLQS